MELWCTQLHDLCKYENINEILYRPSIVPGGGAEQVWGAPAPSPHKTGTAYIIYTGPLFRILGCNITRVFAKLHRVASPFRLV